jgi:acyl carrier protein
MACLRAVLPDPAAPLDPETEILTLSGVDSMVIVALLAKLEEEFGVEIRPELIAPESFGTPRRLAETVRASAREGGESPSGAAAAGAAADGSEAILLGVPLGELSGMLPCAGANLEALLRFLGAREITTLLGGQFHVELIPAERRARFEHSALAGTLERWAGLACAVDRAADTTALLALARSRLQEGFPLLVHADAGSVAWNPYYGHEHFEHAFVLDGLDGARQLAHVVDCYSNATPYGSASPLRDWKPLGDLRALVPPPDEPGFQLLHLVERGVPRPLAEEDVLDLVGRNVTAYRQALVAGRGLGSAVPWLAAGAVGEKDLGWLSLVSWLGARSRALHLEWWRELGSRFPRFGTGEVASLGAEVVTAWQGLQSMAFIAHQRVKAGRPWPQALGASLEKVAGAELGWLAGMTEWREAAGAGATP